jgi:hypothetical protein
MTTPGRDEAADYYFVYIDQVPPGDIVRTLSAQREDALTLFDRISEAGSTRRYAPDKWTIKQVLAHINDTERVFVYRALWFARGCPEALPSFDQNVAMPGSGADDRSWESHVEEFRAVRAATESLFRHMPDAGWSRKGIASGHDVTVRALAYITAGHVAHHVRILRERYL